LHLSHCALHRRIGQASSLNIHPNSMQQAGPYAPSFCEKGGNRIGWHHCTNCSQIAFFHPVFRWKATWRTPRSREVHTSMSTHLQPYPMATCGKSATPWMSPTAPYGLHHTARSTAPGELCTHGSSKQLSLTDSVLICYCAAFLSVVSSVSSS